MLVDLKESLALCQGFVGSLVDDSRVWDGLWFKAKGFLVLHASLIMRLPEGKIAVSMLPEGDHAERKLNFQNMQSMK